MTTPEPLFHAWYRPSHRPRQRRKPWVRVTTVPVTRDAAWEMAHRVADKHGGGDLYVGPVGKDPNEEDV